MASFDHFGEAARSIIEADTRELRRERLERGNGEGAIATSNRRAGPRVRRIKPAVDGEGAMEDHHLTSTSRCWTTNWYITCRNSTASLWIKVLQRMNVGRSSRAITCSTLLSVGGCGATTTRPSGGRCQMERRIRWKLVVLCALLLSACEKRKRDMPVEQTHAGAARAEAVLPRCAPGASSVGGLQQVGTKDGRSVLRLPVGYSSMPTTTGEMWTIPGGTIAYRRTRVDRVWYDSIRTAPSAATHGWCQDTVAGVPSVVQYVYVANAATGPGYYLQLVAPIGTNEEIRLVGRMRDTARAAVLLAIARSLSSTSR